MDDALYTIFDANCHMKNDQVAFVSLENRGEDRFSYGHLYRTVQSKAADLKSRSVYGETALLLYNNTIDFLTSFLACQCVGLIPIPMFFPKNKRHFERLSKVVSSSECKLVLTSENDVEKVLQELSYVRSDLNVLVLKRDLETERIEPTLNSVAFIQYTSGSTSAPKGVVVSQKNLSHNEKMIKEAFGCHADSVILSWLPFYHDMGLIGSLLHTLYCGCKCILMAPTAIVKKPIDWFDAIKKYEVTHTGGPNFIFDLCNDIPKERLLDVDLTSVKVMYNGSEPIKEKTVHQFQNTFGQLGLVDEAYTTCYGLAEATLVVSAGKFSNSDTSINSGELVSEMQVVFYDAISDEIRLDHGEICIWGDSVTQGYWKVNSDDYFVEYEGKNYFRTGDLGRLTGTKLHIEGRVKEMMIINGQNIFPYDLELAVSSLDEVILNNGVSISQNDEKIYVFAEINRDALKSNQAFFCQLRDKVNKELIDTIGIESEAVVFLSPRALSRTSSGKIQRVLIYQNWIDGKFIEYGKEESYIEEKEQVQVEWTPEGIEAYLRFVITQALKLTPEENMTDKSLFELGLSSIKGVEITNRLSKDLNLNIELEQLFELNQLDKVVEYILNLKWLSTKPTQGKEITL